MKKFYVLSLMAMSALGIFAQNLEFMQPTFEKQSLAVKECASVFNASRVAAKAPTADWALMSLPAYGAYFVGVDGSLKSFGVSMVLNGMNQNSLMAYAFGGTDGARPTDIKWHYETLKGERVDMPTDENGNGILKNFGQVGYPIVEGMHNGVPAIYDKTQDPYNKSKEAVVFNLFGSELNITMADIGYIGAFYGQYEDGRCFGPGSTGLESQNGEPLTGAFSLFNKTTTPLVIHEVIVPLCRIDQDKEPMSSDAKLTVEVWTIGEGLSFVEKLGSCEATGSELFSTDEAGFYSMSFEFFDDSASGGLGAPSPVVVGADKTFAVVVKGLDQTNLAVMFSPTGGFEGTGYILYGDTYSNIGTLGYVADPQMPSTHLAISLKADINAAMWQDPIMNCPVEGGLAKVGDAQNYAVVYTSTEIDFTDENTLYTIDAPEWLSLGQLEVIQNDEGGWEKTRAYSLELTAAPLPVGETGRSGVVTITAPYTNLKHTFQIGQGEWTPTGVESVEVAKANVAVLGDNFQLTYGEEFNKVTVYNVAGSVVASYVLPQGGSFEVPAADLNGVYVLVFEGTSREVVKVVK